MADRGINTSGDQCNRDAKVNKRCSKPLFSWAPTASEADRGVVCHAKFATQGGM